VVSGDHAHCWTSDIGQRTSLKKWRDRFYNLYNAAMQCIVQTTRFTVAE